ncbi:hypothetical protein FACS189413_19190 [Bacteroidia bacterium]|nr:hypothetical protein FACS189413_19190 [Bacteroidia bacterium]
MATKLGKKSDKPIFKQIIDQVGVNSNEVDEYNVESDTRYETKLSSQNKYNVFTATLNYKFALFNYFESSAGARYAQIRNATVNRYENDAMRILSVLDANSEAKQRFSDLFPNLTLEYKPNTKISLESNYSRKIGCISNCRISSLRGRKPEAIRKE